MGPLKECTKTKTHLRVLGHSRVKPNSAESCPQKLPDPDGSKISTLQNPWMQAHKGFRRDLERLSVMCSTPLTQQLTWLCLQRGPHITYSCLLYISICKQEQRTSNKHEGKREACMYWTLATTWKEMPLYPLILCGSHECHYFHLLITSSHFVHSSLQTEFKFDIRIWRQHDNHIDFA